MNKVYIIQQMDKKIPLETIAKNKDMRLDALLEKWKPLPPAAQNLTWIMRSMRCSMKIEQDEIIDYFKGCETSSLQLAQEELSDGNYSWEQLKLMRIKFLNTYGM